MRVLIRWELGSFDENGTTNVSRIVVGFYFQDVQLKYISGSKRERLTI